MKKNDIFNAIYREKLVAVIRGNEIAEVKATIRNCVAGGIKLIEITFTAPQADRIIAEARAEYEGSDVVIGAGTVLDAETARIAILAGAKFIVSPAVNLDTVRLCNRYSVPVIPGVFTATEIQTVLDYGVDTVKLFPADIGLLKSLRAPFPNVNFMVTGGVNETTIETYLAAGAAALGAGASLSTLNPQQINRWVTAVQNFKK